MYSLFMLQLKGNAVPYTGLYATAKTVKLRLLQRTAAMSHHADVMLETSTLSKQDVVLLLQLLNYF